MLDADQRQSLVSVRSLGRAGIRVGALECWAGAPAFRSRHATISGLLPPHERDTSRFVDALLERVEEHSARSIICSHDGTIEALRNGRLELEQHVNLALANEDALKVAIDKRLTLELAESIDVVTPRTVPVTSENEFGSAIAEVGLPLVVKPTTSWTSAADRVGCSVATDARGARYAVEDVWSAGGEVVLQEWVGGVREAINIFRASGRTVARFAQVAQRMHPPLGGCSVVRESIPLPRDATDAAEKLVEGAGLDGYAEVEFRRNSSGDPVLMEINPRLSASVELAVRSGVDFPLLLYLWSIGEPVPERNGYREGLRMRWLGGDLLWLRETLRMQGRPDVEPRLRAVWLFVSEFARRSRYDYVSLRDPMPSLVAVAGFPRRNPSRRARRALPNPERAAA